MESRYCRVLMRPHWNHPRYVYHFQDMPNCNFLHIYLFFVEVSSLSIVFISHLCIGMYSPALAFPHWVTSAHTSNPHHHYCLLRLRLPFSLFVVSCLKENECNVWKKKKKKKNEKKFEEQWRLDSKRKVCSTQDRARDKYYCYCLLASCWWAWSVLLSCTSTLSPSSCWELVLNEGDHYSYLQSWK